MPTRNPDGLEKVADRPRASTRSSGEHAVADSPLAELRGDGRRRRRARHRARRARRGRVTFAVRAVARATGVGRPPRRRRPPRPSPRHRPDAMGGAHGTAAARRRRQPRSTASRRSARSLATVVFVFAVVATPREAFWAFGVDARVLVVIARVGPAPARASSPAAGDRAAVPRCSPCSCRSSAATRASRCSACRCRSPGCGRRGTSWSRARSASRPRSCWRRPRRPRPARGPRAAARARVLVAIAAFMVRYVDVHRRRAAPDADRPRVARRTTRAGSGRRGRWRDGRHAVRPLLRARRAGPPGDARRGATPARCPAERRDGDPARLGRAACSSPVAAAAVRRPRSPRRSTCRHVVPALEVARPGASPTRTATPALDGVDLTVERGRAGRAARPERRGQDDARAAPQRHPRRARAGTVTVGGLPVDAGRTCARSAAGSGIVFQDPDDQLFMPTVRDDVAFGPANLGLRGAELDARVDEALDAVGMAEHRRPLAAPPQLRAAPPGGAWPPCWPCDPESSCSTSRRRTSTRPPAASWPRSLSASTSPMLIVTHDLPYALQLCEVRSCSTTAGSSPAATTPSCSPTATYGREPAGTAVRLLGPRDRPRSPA